MTALLANADRLAQQQFFSKQATRVSEMGGHRMGLLPLHFVFDAGDFDELAAAGIAFIGIQGKILRHLVEREGQDGVLERFRVPEAMRRLVSWTELLDPEHLVARFDILQSNAGYHFCEFNIDSCIAGAEIFDFMTDYFEALGVSARDRLAVRAPLEDLAAFIGQSARRAHASRIVILDWSVGGGSAGKGYFSCDSMRDHIAREVYPTPVFIADEKSYDPLWLEAEEARQTLAYRVFMMEEMDDGGQFLARLLQAGTTVINTYESEIRMNKVWFALFHDQRLLQILTASERALIARYIPYTRELTPTDVEGFIERKDEYIFKAKQSFGGIGIRIGAEASAQELRELFAQDGVENWLAQRLIDCLAATFPHDESRESEPQNLVFGMYLYGNRPNGMLVRASRHSKVVNVTAGRAKMAWAACANPAARAELVSCLHEAR